MIMNIIASKDFVTGLIFCDIQIYIIFRGRKGGEMLFPKVYVDTGWFFWLFRPKND